MALWGGRREALRHGLRVLSVVVLVSVVLAAFVIWIVRGLDTAATYAQVVSVLALLSLAGTIGASPKSDPQPSSATPGKAPEPELRKTPPAPVDEQAQPKRQPASALPLHIFFRIGAVASLVAALVVATVLIIPDRRGSDIDPTYKDIWGTLRQPLILISGPSPVLFDNGMTWRWPELPKEGVVLTFSPGGGPLNNGLDTLGGELSEIDNCDSDGSELSWSFRADGHFVGYGSYDQDLDDEISLPDHMDSLVMRVKVTIDPEEKCTLGLQWKKPSISRNKPLSDPAPSSSPS